ncbi:MAG: NAD-dependent epimerase/dehydratase family protein [Alphaproteobacteria bacterium]|nr:NAD-dependent epimerase/dehydratase family protein [Alphaproteobacteria bacterium]MDE2351711.1 NAD-dependent epimerase/dehydratase family protein [Alphaproteobacteria bacterium]
MGKVLVTGAAGFVGRRVVALLAAAYGQFDGIIAADIRAVPESERLAGVTYRVLDVRDGRAVDAALAEGIEAVVHLAAIVSPGGPKARAMEYEVDVMGTGNVLKACILHRVRQLVVTSSGAAYGYHADNPVPLSESDALRGNPEFAYSDHKRLVEEMLARARAEHPELKQLIFRPGTILGARVANPITAMFDRPFVLGVTGSDTPFVLIWDEDVARCIVKGLMEARDGIYNLTSDDALPMAEIARMLGKPFVPLPAWLIKAILFATQRLGLSQAGPAQVNFIRYRPVLSNARLKREFGYDPGTRSRDVFARWLKERVR